MKITRAEKKIEAVARMKALKIYPETVKQFEHEDLVSISELPFGAYFWAQGEELEIIKQFEKKHNALVYTAIKSYTEFGKLLSLLFVSDYKNEEWDTDRADLKEGMVLAYVNNCDIPEFSEFGTIGFKLGLAAGLVRTW